GLRSPLPTSHSPLPTPHKPALLPPSAQTIISQNRVRLPFNALRNTEIIVADRRKLGSMKKRRWLNGCAFLALFICGGLFAVSAQQSQNAQPQKAKSQQKPGEKKPGDKPENLDPQIDKAITINVRLPVTITDKSNRFVSDLKESDFAIIEDKTPQTILNFDPQSNLPLDVAMLMDTSNSVKPKLKFEKDAAYSFLETVLKFRQDRALFA